MNTVIHRAESRGYADHGWLKSYHTFSFASYQNPQRMHFGMLRVFNDDVVKPKMGFGTHPHQNMEIISIPLQGALSHKDSMGNKRAIEVGEVQVMSAGTGLTHSEFNDSRDETVNFLQLWIFPEQQNVKPNYEQKAFDLQERKNKLQVVVAPKDNLLTGALPINQQAYIYQSDLDKDKQLQVPLKINRNGIYIFVVEGSVEVDGETLRNRDAIGIWNTLSVTLTALTNTKLVIVEVPMN